MKINKLAVVVVGVFFGWISGVAAQPEVVAPEVAASAQAAVQKLGLEMVKGNFTYGTKRMYPRWKKRLAVQHGGMEKLNAGLARAAKQKIKIGFIVVSSQAGKPSSFFTVWRAKKRDPQTREILKDATGREMIVEHWLAVVPTVTRVKISDPQRGGAFRTLEEKGYTIAISEKGKNNWYFLTGMKPTINDLRSMFPSLPSKKEDLKLPASSVKELK